MTSKQFLSAWSEAELALALAESVVESIGSPLAILDDGLYLRRANRAFWRECPRGAERVDNQWFFDIADGWWDLPGLRDALDRVRKDRATEAEGEFTRQDGRPLAIKFRRIEAAGQNLLFITIERPLLQSDKQGREQAEFALHASEDALLQSREELRHLSASLMNAQDIERRRVARELHDDLGQKVARLQFEVETLEQKVPFTDLQDARKRLHDVGQQAAGLSEDLRRVAHQLHPATLDHLGLTVALQSYAEEFSRSTAIPVKFTSLFVPRKVPIQLASGLYRVVQEALRNVGKHSSSAAVEIVLARAPEGLALFIRDNGEGFDLDEARARGGLGLIGMQERVRLLDGSFSVETKPGKGVLITIQCPLPDEQS